MNTHWLIFFSSIAIPRTPPRAPRRPARNGPGTPAATRPQPGPVTGGMCWIVIGF